MYINGFIIGTNIMKNSYIHILFITLTKNLILPCTKIKLKYFMHYKFMYKCSIHAYVFILWYLLIKPCVLYLPFSSEEGTKNYNNIKK